MQASVNSLIAAIITDAFLNPRVIPEFCHLLSILVLDCVHTMLAHSENGEKCDGSKI